MTQNLELTANDFDDLFPRNYTPGKTFQTQLPLPGFESIVGGAITINNYVMRAEKAAEHAIVDSAKALGHITADFGAGTYRLAQRSALAVGRELQRDARETAIMIENYLLLKEFRDIILKKAIVATTENATKEPTILSLKNDPEPIYIPQKIMGSLTPQQLAMAAPIKYKVAAPTEEDNPIKSLIGLAAAITILGYAAVNSSTYINAVRTTARSIEEVITAPFKHPTPIPIPKIPEISPALPDGKYLLLGDFISQENATSFAKDLLQKGLDTTNITPIKTNKGSRYRLATPEKNIDLIAELYNTPSAIIINAQDGRQKTITIPTNKTLQQEQPIRQYLQQSAKQYNVQLTNTQINDLTIHIKGIIMQESSGALGTRGNSDDTGRMQVIPETAYLVEYTKDERVNIDKNPKLRLKTIKELSDKLLIPGEDIRIGTKVFMSSYANWYNQTHNHAKSKRIATAEYNRGNDGLAELAIAGSRASRYVNGVNKFYTQFTRQKKS